MLHHNYNYTVRMAAVTSAGIGPFSAPVTATTLEGGSYVLVVLFLHFIV